MIGIVTLEGDEALWPIAAIIAEGGTEAEEQALRDEELERIREKLADMAVAEVRETFDADADLDEDERTARDRHLGDVREAVTSRIAISWDDSPTLVAGEGEQAEAERAVFSRMKEWIELTEGSISEMVA